MHMVIKSKYGVFEIGGGKHSSCRLLEIAGLGIPVASVDTVTFAGAAGYTVASKTDGARTITMAFDFSGTPLDALKILKILQAECEIFMYFSGCERKIKGNCLNSSDIEKIIYNKMYKIVLQFECPNPYFEDIQAPDVSLSTRVNMLPTSYEYGKAYIELPTVATVRRSESIVINSGDVPVHPKFTIIANGDMESIILENRTTGAFIKINYAIVNGEIITIDVKNREITSSIQGNILNKQSDDTIMADFFLAEGENDILLANNTRNSIDVIIQFANQYKAVMLA